jgi:preprotein translocase subunit YajC
MPQLLVFVLFFAGVYFLLLRPQQQRVRRQRELITAIGVGDRVVTAGGLIGRVIDENGDRLWLEIADGITVEFLRLAISRKLDDSELGADAVETDDEVDEESEPLDDEEPTVEEDLTSPSSPDLAAVELEDAPTPAQEVAPPAPGQDPH